MVTAVTSVASAPPDLLQKLMPGEKLLWFGKPATGFRFGRQDWFLVPFSLVWGGFAVFWEVAAYQMDGPWPTLAFGGLFVAVGLYIMFGRFFADSYFRSQTTYALTNRRILTMRQGFWPKLSSFSLYECSKINLIEHKDGLGSISFCSKVGQDDEAQGFSGWTASGRGDETFAFIAQPTLVFNTVLQARDACLKESSEAFLQR